MSSHFSLKQNIYSHANWDIDVHVCHENDLSMEKFGLFMKSIKHDTVGLYATYGAKSAISKLAVASISSVLVVSFKAGPTSVKKGLATRKHLQDRILSSSTIHKSGFFIDKLAYSLFHDLDIRIDYAFNMAPLEPQFDPFHEALGGRDFAHEGQTRKLFQTMYQRDITVENIATQAWAAAISGTLPGVQQTGTSSTPMSTLYMDTRHLQMASKLHRHQTLLRRLVPDVEKNEIKSGFNFSKGKLNVVSTRFKTRIQENKEGQHLQLSLKQGNKTVNVSAKTKKVNGRSVSISLGKLPVGVTAVSVKTVGQKPPSNSEEIRATLFGYILQGRSLILSNPFAQTIWFPHATPVFTSNPICSKGLDLMPSSKYELNPSQINAITTILSRDKKDRVVLIHGPPGTGKTTVIGAATHTLTSRDSKACIWLVAHSNVAVKNIAEKLLRIEFEKFKIVVSKDFHYDWHEHLYHQVEERMIRTDSLPETTLEAARLLRGCRVILCTLASLLNSRLAPITLVVPVQTLVMDEASQIEIGEYIPVIHRYQNCLRKMVFIGDHKQLAPYGYEDIKELESIFEKSHLQRAAVMLDTQYRMPIPIGSFISTHVYEGRLKSDHRLSSWKTCRFVDVKGSKEEKKGQSWVNIKEMRAAIAVAQTLHSGGLNFKIITPYDAQRAMLENELKSQKLPFEDNCFNVDSFQGNEADHIIISLVRSAKIGFLREDRRVNVMLTRCKKGMVICTNRPFVRDIASGTLVGKLAYTLGERAWIDSHQVVHDNINPFA